MNTFGIYIRNHLLKYFLAVQIQKDSKIMYDSMYLNSHRIGHDSILQQQKWSKLTKNIKKVRKP